MGKVIINQGKTNTLVITIPAKGDVDWAAQIRQAFQDICDHDHTGGIKGKKITGDALADNTITINNIDLSTVNLNTFLNIQDGTTIPSGSVLLWSEENQEWYPSTIQNLNSSSNVYVISNDTELNGYDPTPGDIVYVDSQGQANPFNNGVVGAADFSFYNKNLKGVKIISNNIPLVMAELNECKIMSNQAVTLASVVTNSEIRATNITIQGIFENSQANSGGYNIILDGANVQSSSLQGSQLQDTATTNAINYSQGFFHKINLTSASTTIAASSKIEASQGILSLSGTPSFSGTTTKPVTIVNQEIRTQVLPESGTSGHVLTWNGSTWVGQTLSSSIAPNDIPWNGITPSTYYPKYIGIAPNETQIQSDDGLVYTRRFTKKFTIPRQSDSTSRTYQILVQNIISYQTSTSPLYSDILTPAEFTFNGAEIDINGGQVSATLNLHHKAWATENYHYSISNGSILTVSGIKTDSYDHIDIIKDTNHAVTLNNTGSTDLYGTALLHVNGSSTMYFNMEELNFPRQVSVPCTNTDLYLKVAVKYLEDVGADANIWISWSVKYYQAVQDTTESTYTFPTN